MEMLLTLEDYCAEDEVFRGMGGALLVPAFAKILHMLYAMDVLSEVSVLAWAEEKEGAEEEDKRFLKLAQPFVDWLPRGGFGERGGILRRGILRRRRVKRRGVDVRIRVETHRWHEYRQVGILLSRGLAVRVVAGERREISPRDWPRTPSHNSPTPPRPYLWDAGRRRWRAFCLRRRLDTGRTPRWRACPCF